MLADQTGPQQLDQTYQFELGQTYAVTTRAQAQRLAQEQPTQQRDSTEEVETQCGGKGCNDPTSEMEQWRSPKKKKKDSHREAHQEQQADPGI